MFRKLFPIILLVSILIFSCKSAPENIQQTETPAEEPVVSEKVSGGQTEMEEPMPEESGTDSAMAPLTETENPSPAEPESPPLKSISKTGGMKIRELQQPIPAIPEPAAENPPEDNMPDQSAVSDEPADRTPDQETILPEATEVPPSAALIEPANGEVPAVTVVSELPADNEENAYNPLLPVVIIPESKETQPVQGQLDDSSTNQPIRQSDSNRMNADTQKAQKEEESVSVAPVPSENPEAPSVKPEAISADLYTLTADSTGKLTIYLQGAGWIYLSSSNSNEIILRDKSYDPESGRTRFVFSGAGLKDDFELIFLKQDLLRGESDQKSLAVNSVNNPFISGNDTNRESRESNTVEQKSDGGLTIPQTTDTAEQINSQASDSDVVAAEESAPVTVSGTGPASEETAAFPPEGLGAAGLLEQARKYENPGPEQSLEKAIFLYEKIRSDYPVTEERFIAEERIRYLNKHYFKVQ